MLLKSSSDVMHIHSSCFRNLFYRHNFFVLQLIQDNKLPIRLIGNLAQVRQRFLRSPGKIFLLGQQVTEVNQKSSITKSLINGKSHDARNIVSLSTMFLFRKVSNQMASFAVISSQDVKEKWFDIIIQSFVVQKQFRQQTEILTINFARQSIHFKNRQTMIFVVDDVSFTIDFSSRGTSILAFVLWDTMKTRKIHKNYYILAMKRRTIGCQSQD